MSKCPYWPECCTGGCCKCDADTRAARWPGVVFWTVTGGVILALLFTAFMFTTDADPLRIDAKLRETMGAER